MQRGVERCFSDVMAAVGDATSIDPRRARAASVAWRLFVSAEAMAVDRSIDVASPTAAITSLKQRSTPLLRHTAPPGSAANSG